MPNDIGILWGGFAGATLLSYFLVYACRWLAHRAQILDVANERSLHTGAKARTGGLAIVLLTVASGAIFGRSLMLPYWLAAALLIAAVSFYDDLKGLSTAFRFGVHFLAAGIILFGLPPVSLSIPGWGLLPSWLTLGLFLFWMVGLTNAYNFMDGSDGIAGTQAVLVGLAWMLASLCQAVSPTAGLLGAVVAGSALGFLGHNWEPSKIFLGDVGSAFLGFTFAVIPLLDGATSKDLTAQVGAAVSLLWPFLADTLYTFIRRLLRRENVFQAHRSHLYQRLILAGWKHRSIAYLYGVLSLLGWLPAWLWWQQQPFAWLVTLFISTVGFLWLRTKVVFTEIIR